MAAIFTLVISVGVLSGSILLYRRTRRARSYVPVPGRIIERSLAGAFLGGVPVGRYYGPRVKYTYRVGGSEFVGDRYAFYQRNYDHRRAQEELAKLPDEVIVYVDPRDPSEAVIERSGRGLAIGVGCAGTVGFLIALLIFAVQ